MKTGLLITAYNRTEYLKQCLESVSKINYFGELSILIIDDYSQSRETIDLIRSFEMQDTEIHKIFLTRNQGIKNVLRFGLNYLFSKECELVINLDADAIVKNDFIEVLKTLKKAYPSHIISGFNTQTIDLKTKKIRHKILKTFPDHCIKKSIGGINMVLNKFDYLNKVLPSLKRSGHWDWNVCELVYEFIVSTPSVVQHIGIDKGSNMNNPDIAFDF
jgi:glycosyltransferase involved in cell wall biosynthesis